MPSPETKVSIPPELESFNPEVFRNALSEVIKGLGRWETLDFDRNEIEKEMSFIQLRGDVTKEISDLSDPEKLLFGQLFNLCMLKYQIGEAKRAEHHQVFEDPKGTIIWFLGALAVGKTTVAESVKKVLSVVGYLVGTVDPPPHLRNIFWGPSQIDSQFMLPSQDFFLMAGINSDIKARKTNKIFVFDESTINNVLVWADWYHKTGRFDEEDYQVYLKLVEFLKPIIPWPDLLVVLMPDEDDLGPGIRARADALPKRRQEVGLIPDINGVQIPRVEYLVNNDLIVGGKWGFPFIQMKVDPPKLFRNQVLQDACARQIIEELGLTIY